MRHATICLFALVGLTPVIAFAQIKDGFRDMRWGDAPTQDFDRVERGSSERSFSSGNAVKYRRRSDKLSIGDVKVRSIFYYFEDNKLREVVVDVNGSGSSTEFWKIADILKATYGAPEVNEHRLDGGGVFSRWNKDNTKIFLTLRDTPVDIVNGTDLKIIDKTYQEQVARGEATRNQQENARKGRDDL